MSVTALPPAITTTTRVSRRRREGPQQEGERERKTSNNNNKRINYRLNKENEIGMVVSRHKGAEGEGDDGLDID